MRLKYGGHRGRALLAAVAAVLVATAAILIVVAVRAQKQAPQPPASAAGSYAAGRDGSVAPPKPGGATGAAPKTRGPVLAASAPLELSIPAIGVKSGLLRLGLNPDRTVQVPPLGADSQAGWYRNSPTPGALGPAVILGHIDSARYGPGVFFKLGALRKGDTVSVRRADHTVAVFRIDAVAEYAKNHFPTFTVYGNTDHAALRLITCGGKFDFSTHNYEDNIVAFASLVSAHPAT